MPEWYMHLKWNSPMQIFEKETFFSYFFFDFKINLIETPILIFFFFEWKWLSYRRSKTVAENV